MTTCLGLIKIARAGVGTRTIPASGIVRVLFQVSAPSPIQISSAEPRILQNILRVNPTAKTVNIRENRKKNPQISYENHKNLFTIFTDIHGFGG